MYAERYRAAHDEDLAPGAKRMLVLNVRVEDTHEQAVEKARPYHDEFWKFLGPYGWSRGYKADDGRPAAPGLIPSLEESIEQGTWVVGDADSVAEQIATLRDRLELQDLIVFPNALGEGYAATEDQLHRLSETVLPQVDGVAVR
jgi:alkanesulfonate monooxygenase SsuD/methylene tetrahydromethanopterin reductase-like flavin-dependent oxidoreductase (luciferase family)